MPQDGRRRTGQPRKRNGRDKARNYRASDELHAEWMWAVEVREAGSASILIRRYLEGFIRATKRMEAQGLLPYQQRSEQDDDKEPPSA